LILVLIVCLPAVALGWLLVRRLIPCGWLLEISLGAGLGMGISSLVFFLLLAAGVTGRWAVLACEAALAGGFFFIPQGKRLEQLRSGSPSWTWGLRIAAALALGMFGMDFSAATQANPYGEWDAFSIWNVRAKFLAGGAQTWRYAVDEQLANRTIGSTHPGYPLLVSGFVARAWTVSGDSSLEAPAAVSLLFTLATFGLLLGAVTRAKSEALGWIALLVLLATEGFVSQSAAQYADIPLSFYVLGTVASLDAEAFLVAGVCAGLAAWTKNEGLPFLLLAGGAALWRWGGRNAARFAAGAAPAALTALCFKMFLALVTESMFPKTAAEALAKLSDGGRWVRVASSFARNAWELGVPWAHPLLLIGVTGLAFGFVSKQEARSRLWLGLPLAGLLATEFGIYLLTTANLTWHLGTSNSRLLAQVWPAAVFILISMLNRPDASTGSGGSSSRPRSRA
jgi:hypothetical protein